MEKEYIKELDRAYLVLREDQFDEDEYVLQMAMRGRLPGILPLGIVGKDGKKSLRAEVTACTSIASRYKHTAVLGSDMRKILSAVRDTASRMPALLMSVRDLYLDPDCIFLGPGGDEVLLCYIPHISSQEPDSVRLLSEFLLRKIDHSDQAAAALAYTLYDQVSEDSCDLYNVLSGIFDNDQAAASGHDQYSGSVDSSQNSRESSKAQYYESSYSDSYSPAGSGSAPDPYSYSERRDYTDYPGSQVRKLTPPDRRRKKKPAAKHTAKRSHRNGGLTVSKKTLIPAVILVCSACAAIVIFRMDLTQICGMGFLCASIIWIIHTSVEKHSNEVRNYWFDDDDSLSDDRFYQSLRKELYSEDPLFKDTTRQSMESGTGQGGSYSFGSGDAAGTSHGREAFYGAADDQTHLLRAQSPSLISLRKDRCSDITLNKDHLILGKSRAHADIVLPGDTVSRKHARIERRVDGYYVTDLFSTNGTFLDGHRLESGQAVQLKNGAQLTIASLSYRVMIPADPAA